MCFSKNPGHPRGISPSLARSDQVLAPQRRTAFLYAGSTSSWSGSVPDPTAAWKRVCSLLAREMLIMAARLVGRHDGEQPGVQKIAKLQCVLDSEGVKGVGGAIFLQLLELPRKMSACSA